MYASGDDFDLSSPVEPPMHTAAFAAAASAAAVLPNLLAWVVTHKGRVVAEHYYAGATATSANHIRSVTKGITSTLAGIAVDQGAIPRLDTAVLEYLPECDTAGLDERKRAITLEHLLTMTAGFQWSELTFEEAALAEVSDWFGGGKRSALSDALRRPLACTPGTAFNYDSPAADLLSVVLTRATGRDLCTFAIEYLFDPLDITAFEWETDPAGFYRGSAGLVMRPRDLAKIGQLYLQRGEWHGRQIVSSTWIEQATKAQVALDGGYGYGWLWWVGNGAPVHFFSGVGYGGQLLLVAPALELVVVANHRWHDVPAGMAVKQSTDFYHQVFVRVVGELQ
jgi:CubicO group peptidase (beta-lactamase class C family)